MKKNKQSKIGFSLIEVLIFIVVLSIFFVTSISVTINSLKSMKISEHKIIATKYAEEMLEWLKGEKATDWDAFMRNADSPNPSHTKCLQFNKTDIVWTNNIACGPDDANQDIPDIYTREVAFTVDPLIPQVRVSINVRWAESGQAYTIPLGSTFTPWQ